MIRKYSICILLLLFTQVSDAKIWSSQAGSSLEADLIKIRAGKVSLRSPGGQIFETSFSNLGEADQLYLREGRWQDDIYSSDTAIALNDFLGIELFAGEPIWEESEDIVAERIGWRLISRTEVGSSYQRSKQNGRRSGNENMQLFNQDVRSAFLYTKNTRLEYILFVYNNIKDVKAKPQNQRHEEELREQLDDSIHETAKSVAQALTNLLGKPQNQAFYNGRIESHRMKRWDFGDVVFLLTHDKGFSLSLYIHEADFVNRNGRVTFSQDELKGWFAANVENRSNGDTVIKNIPMVSQGESGFCVPATFERYLRYIGIPADMYTLAMLGETRIAGGTRVNKLRDEISRYLGQQGLRMRRMSSALNVKRISEYIDQGIPLIWTMSSTRTFNQHADNYTRNRTYKSLPEKENFIAPHTLIVTGYNEAEEAISISDSWGPKYEERWIPLALAKQYDLAGLFVVDF